MNKEKVIKYQPFIKWVGGKRGLLTQLLERFPEEFNNYHEPFLGGGAVFFELYSKGLLKNKEIYLSDINSELINTYNVIKNSPNELINNLKCFKNQHSKEFYYEIRSLDRKEGFKNLSNIERATRFIYLNKTCFNGLYRVNKKGFFNNSIGSYKNPNIADIDTIMNASESLQNVNILNSKFNEVLNNVAKNDLVYLDPPYYPLDNKKSFTAYSEFDFLEKEQQELFTIFEELNKKECSIFHSNSDTNFIKELYKDYNINYIQANRFLNSKSSGRGKINELLINNSFQ